MAQFESLAPYAVRVEDTRGRRYPETPHPYRNDYQRDRDRIIHARSFRRLENKTQVFTARVSDHFRTRLTHTIEVAQISRTIAGVLRLNQDLVEALALVHDIGHPPFGHSGERALDELMKKHGLRFDHNLHALRIVENFELRYAEFPGLNLTFEVREGIIKHSHDYSPAEYPELSEYLLDSRPPIEAQLIDLTDEIGYTTADMDDGFEARLLKAEQTVPRVRLFERNFRDAERKYPSAPPKLKFNEALKRMLNEMVTDVIENTSRQIARHQITTLEDVRHHPQRLVAFSPKMEEERREAKQFLYENLYLSAPLRPAKLDGERVVADMFEHWIRHPETLPLSYQRKTEKEPLPRVICDYIAGMTDNFIVDQHRRLGRGEPSRGQSR
jgi:dGTPase